MSGQQTCGDMDDSFVAGIRYTAKEGRKDPCLVAKVGHRMLHQSLWRAKRTPRCSHHPETPAGDVYLLPVRICATNLASEHSFNISSIQSKVVILLTANNTASRWNALQYLGYVRYHAIPGHSPSVVLLRTSDCCGLCAINHALLEAERCFLVL
jgi:hypothetical protein